MGLRTASVRHPHAEVMAPALTETKPTQTFKLPLDEQSASPVNNATAAVAKQQTHHHLNLNLNLGHHQHPAAAVYIARDAATRRPLPPAAGIPSPPACDDAAHVAGEPTLNGGDTPTSQHDAAPQSLFSMADGDAMGLRKSHVHEDGDDATSLANSASDAGATTASDLLLKADVDEQLFDQMPACAAGVAEDDIMQVFKAIDDEEGALTLGEDDDDAAALAAADDLFAGVVDVMNMSCGSVDGDELLAQQQQQQQEQEQREIARQAQIRAHLGDVSVRHARLERKFDFLLRRIRKHQMRAMGQHAAAEVAGVFENVARSLKRYTSDVGDVNEPPATSTVSGVDFKPLDRAATKTLIKKLELNNAMQANATFRARMRKHSMASGVVPPETFRSPPNQTLPLPKWPLREKKELENVAGYLESEVRFVQEEVDSEATASSSGADSCDDTETYNNPHQQHLPINKRAAWKYATERAAIGSKWTWLQSQIADLEYKIRQYNDLYRKLRANKDPVKLDGDTPPPSIVGSPDFATPNCLNGYRGTLPGATVRNGETSAVATDKCGDYQCARTRPLVGFRKRKLYQVTGLHAVSKKAERPATVRCGCTPPAVTCALCTGRVDPTYPRDHAEYLSHSETMGLLDPAYHPVFSLEDAASASLHLEGVVRMHDWKQWSIRASLKALPKAKGDRVESTPVTGAKDQAGTSRPRKAIEHRKKNNRLIKPSTANALSAKIKNRARTKKPSRTTSSMAKRSRKRSRNTSAQSLGSDGNDEDLEMLGSNAGGKFDAGGNESGLQSSIANFNKRNRADSYDIDNIIIPFSVATTVRVEKLPYKEILTPKWRCITEDDNMSTAKHNNEVKNNGTVKTSQDPVNLKDIPEDLSDAAVLLRHEKSEQEERKKFLSYLKLPIGYGRSRANRRTDSLAESSGANTPDPMSPASMINFDAPPPPPVDKETLRPATPKPDEQQLLASRRRTISSTRGGGSIDSLPHEAPYEKRLFPLSDDAYQRMLRVMQSQHGSSRSESQPPSPFARSMSDANDAEATATSGNMHTTNNHNTTATTKEPDSESTESAFGDDDPDPTDPEWEAERAENPFNR